MRSQFGTFDGLDNRRTVMELFQRLGEKLPEAQAARARAGFLQALIALSAGSFAAMPIQVTPCSAAEAYMLFIAITGVLSVDIQEAAILLERVVSKL